jgi:hypothetical protein
MVVGLLLRGGPEMDTKSEGAVLPPFPMTRRESREASLYRGCPPRSNREPRCEMCGADVIATHCKRICLKCGFMTGCSEGI